MSIPTLIVQSGCVVPTSDSKPSFQQAKDASEVSLTCTILQMLK